MSDNWIVQNLENALETWNSKLAEIWTIVTQSPENFKGGIIWDAIKNIYGGMQAVGFALLVLFFVIGVMKTCGSLTEVKIHMQWFLVLQFCYYQHLLYDVKLFR